MDEPVERGRMSGDPTAQVKSDTGLFMATFERRRLSLMMADSMDELAVSVRGSPTTSCSMFINKEIATALTRWLQTRIAEM
jgi:hypothetical protein